MKTTIGVIVEANSTLTGIKNLNDLSILTSWKVDDLLEVLQKHAIRFDKQRFELIKKLGTKNKQNPELWDIPDLEQFEKELEKILSIEVELECKKLPMSIFESEEIKVPKGMSTNKLKLFIDAP